MRKITKALVALFLAAITCMTSVTALASEGPESRLTHMDSGLFSFAATADGGYIDVTYYTRETFVRADLTVKIEKRFLFFWWNEVNTWSASSTEHDGQFINCLALDGSGTYRASFTLTVTGNDGTVDTIPHVIEDSY